MTEKQHTRRHIMLNAALDELVADWIMQRAKNGESFFTSSITLEEFLKWSNEQAKEATPIINSAGEEISFLYHKKHPKSRRVWNLPLYPMAGQTLKVKK